jgi:probable phosphoglycerate mutase
VPPQNHPLIYYVRHGLTDWNAEARFQGRMDIPLNAIGRQQAKRNGQALAKHLEDPGRFDFICSPLLRTRETMEIIRSEMGLPVGDYRIDDLLIEAAYGDLEGVSLGELEKSQPALFNARKENRWHFQPPGGESLQMTMERVAPLFDSLVRPTIVVAHGAVGRAVRRHLLGLDEHEAGWFEFQQDRVFRFEGGKEVLV